MKYIFFILFISMKLYSQIPFWVHLDKFPCTWNIREITFDKNGNGYFACGGIYKTMDEGISWELLGLKNEDIDQIIIDNDGNIFIQNNDGHILRSKDNGNEWEDLYKKVGWEVYHDLFVNRRGQIFAGPYRSNDNGETWFQWWNGTGAFFIFAMNSEGHIFRGGFGSNETICRSTDDGDTWEVVYEDPNEWPNGAVCETVHNMIFSKTDPVGYACSYKTTNNGRSWYIMKDLNSEPAGTAMMMDSLKHIYSFRSGYGLPVYYEGLYKRIIDSTWEKVDTSGLNSEKYFNTMATSPNGYIYLAAHNGGLYRSRDRYVSVPETQEPPGSKERLSASPNPATDYIEISGINPPANRWAKDRIRIYNALGEIVLFVGARHALPLRVDVSGLPPGVYFVRLGDQVYKFLKISPSGGG